MTRPGWLTQLTQPQVISEAEFEVIQAEAAARGGGPVWIHARVVPVVPEPPRTPCLRQPEAGQ